jgi:hypothetical protein
MWTDFRTRRSGTTPFKGFQRLHCGSPTQKNHAVSKNKLYINKWIIYIKKFSFDVTRLLLAFAVFSQLEDIVCKLNVDHSVFRIRKLEKFTNDLHVPALFNGKPGNLYG